MAKLLVVCLSLLNLGFANQILFDEVKSSISKMESGGKYTIVNKNGFLGKYQFGAMSLVDLGLLSHERYKSLTYTMSTATRKAKVMWRDGQTLNSFVNNPNNWNINGGKDGFLNSPQLQERAMDRQLERNYKILAKRGFDMSNHTLAKSLLMASHFGGISSAINYANNGTEYKDAFGTSISKYYGDKTSKPANKKVVFKFED